MEESDMSFRFWRRVKILPGVTLNLSKSGGSLSFGPRGAKVTIGPRGRRTTVGIPGTGLFYTKTYGNGKSRGIKKDSSPSSESAIRPEERLSLGFFKRLVTPKDEEALVDGCREWTLGNDDKALAKLKDAAHLADGAFLAGFLALKKNKLNEAERFFLLALDKNKRLGAYFSKYGVAVTMTLPVTGEYSAHIVPDIKGTLLAITEVYQRLGRREDAADSLKRLKKFMPEDVIVRLSLAELTMERGDKKAFKEVVKLTEGIENASPAHTTLLLYKARALKGLGLLDAARDALTLSLRKKKDRSEDLLRAIRYERALVYEALGQKTRARKDLEKIYADAPDYEDAAQRLGL